MRFGLSVDHTRASPESHIIDRFRTLVISSSHAIHQSLLSALCTILFRRDSSSAHGRCDRMPSAQGLLKGVGRETVVMAGAAIGMGWMHRCVEIQAEGMEYP